MNKRNVLSYGAYRERLKNLNTREDIAAFVQELVTPAISGLQPETSVHGEAEMHAADSAPQLSESEAAAEKFSSAVPKASGQHSPLSPWYEVIGNDTEAMIVSLYAKGMTTRDIVQYLKHVHDIDMSQPSISAITDKVFPLIKEWQARPLSNCYPIVYLDGLRFKVRETGKIVPKVAYLALALDQYGQKEVLGIWTSPSEGAKFWMQVLTDIKNRGVEDILIACVDGLKGFPEAIKAMYPNAEVQVCIAHQIRHTIMFVPHKYREQFCNDLKVVYTAPTEEAGMQALKEMQERWPQYRAYLKSWEQRWADLAPFFGYPEPIRKIMYTTNAIENLNRQFRKVTKTTSVFPHDDALVKLLWLAQADIAQTWTMPHRNWGEVMAQLSILFPDRVQF